MLGSLIKQTVSGMEAIPKDIPRAIQEEKNAIVGGGRNSRILWRCYKPSHPRDAHFLFIDALDEYAAVHRVKILDSLNQILEKS